MVTGLSDGWSDGAIEDSVYIVFCWGQFILSFVASGHYDVICLVFLFSDKFNTVMHADARQFCRYICLFGSGCIQACSAQKIESEMLKKISGISIFKLNI